LEFLHLSPSCVGDWSPTLFPSPRVSGERVPEGRVRGLLGRSPKTEGKALRWRRCNRAPGAKAPGAFSRKREKVVRKTG
jgi:hypothetical protein